MSQDGTAFARHHTRGDQQLVVHSRVVSERVERLNRPRLRVMCAIDEPFHAALEKGAAAHGAWLKSDVQCAFVEPPVSNGFCCLRDGNHFRVGRRVTEHLTLIVGSGNHLSFVNNDGSHGYLVCFERLLGKVQRLANIEFVRGRIVKGFFVQMKSTLVTRGGHCVS